MIVLQESFLNLVRCDIQVQYLMDLALAKVE